MTSPLDVGGLVIEIVIKTVSPPFAVTELGEPETCSASGLTKIIVDSVVDNPSMLTYTEYVVSVDAVIVKVLAVVGVLERLTPV